jgi:hypothetical protein
MRDMPPTPSSSQIALELHLQLLRKGDDNFTTGIWNWAGRNMLIMT